MQIFDLLFFRGSSKNNEIVDFWFFGIGSITLKHFTRYMASGIRHLVSGIWYLVSGIRYLVPCTYIIFAIIFKILYNIVAYFIKIYFMRRSLPQNAIFIFILSLMLISCGQEKKVKEKKQNDPAEIPVYTIGVNLPLSGNGSYFADEFQKGMDLAFDFINERWDKVRIDVIYEDNKLNPKDAVSITKKFLEVDNVDLIVCGYTPLIQATAGLVNQHETPMLASLSSAEGIATPYEWVFRDFDMESVSMPLLANYAYSGLELKKGSWLVVNDDMGRDAVRFFSDEYTALGGQMTEGAVFEPSEMDLRNKISKVMENDPEFIVVLGRGSAMINACRQIRERDADIPIMGNMTMENEIIWEALGPLGNNIWYPRLYIDYQSDRFLRINEMFVKRFGYDMNWLSVYGFSIANYLARGLKESKGDKQAIKEYLRNLNYPSIRGLLTMNADGDVNVVNVICQRKDGASIIVNIKE